MTAVIIQFPARVGDTTPITATPQGPAQVTRLSSRPLGLTNDDCRALKVMMTKLVGDWLCEIETDADGSAYAVLARCEMSRVDFFNVVRRGAKLRLLASDWPNSCVLLGVYRRVNDLTDAFGNTAGWRRHASPR